MNSEKSMPVRAALANDIDFVSNLDASLAKAGGEYPYCEPRFARLFSETLLRRSIPHDHVTNGEPDWDTKFYIIEAKGSIRAGFAVTSNWISTDEISQKASLTQRDIRLWFVGVMDGHRGNGLAQSAIQHIIEEPRPNNEPGSDFGLYETKLAAKIHRSFVRSSDLLENYFDFDPAPSMSDKLIFVCPISRSSR